MQWLAHNCPMNLHGNRQEINKAKRKCAEQNDMLGDNRWTVWGRARIGLDLPWHNNHTKVFGADMDHI